MSKAAALATALAAGASAGVLLGVGVLWAAVELDDGAHDIFGPDLPATDYRVQTHQPGPDR
jgi:hypothetical protein